jgi:hypothetical protein
MVKAVPKKKKLDSLTKLKGKLDTIFSQYIRISHADDYGYCTCYTCGAVLHWKEIQNGHLFSRGRLGTRFDPDNCRPQCFGCNCMQKGNYQEYFPRIIDEIGLANMELLEENSKAEIKLDRAFYVRSIEYYKVQVNILLQAKGAFYGK